MSEYHLFKAINNIDKSLEKLNLNSLNLEREVSYLLNRRNEYLKKYCPADSKRDWRIKSSHVLQIVKKINWMEVWVKKN